MRKFKFRVWDTKNKKFLEFIPPEEYMLDSEIWNHSDEYATLFYPKNLRDFNGRLIYQQYTGLKDINDKEIYEGDIVKVYQDHIKVLLGDEWIKRYTCGEVRWLKEAFKVCQSGIGATHLGDFSSCDCCPCGLEVIGNVFETPNLLEGSL